MLGQSDLLCKGIRALWWWVAKEVRGLTNPCSLWRKTSARESGRLAFEGAGFAPP
jgi:hypothetical protein